MTRRVVIMLEWTLGDIEFSGSGFEFDDASGPIVPRVFRFLGIVAATRLFCTA